VNLIQIPAVLAIPGYFNRIDFNVIQIPAVLACMYRFGLMGLFDDWRFFVCLKGFGFGFGFGLVL
jgi:hypothetical protein